MSTSCGKRRLCQHTDDEEYLKSMNLKNHSTGSVLLLLILASLWQQQQTRYNTSASHIARCVMSRCTALYISALVQALFDEQHRTT